MNWHPRKFNVGDAVRFAHTNDVYKAKQFVVRIADPDPQGNIVVAEAGHYMVAAQWNLELWSAT